MLNEALKEFHFKESLDFDGNYRPARILAGEEEIRAVTKKRLFMTCGPGKLELTMGISKVNVLEDLTMGESVKFETDTVFFSLGEKINDLDMSRS